MMKSVESCVTETSLNTMIAIELLGKVALHIDGVTVKFPYDSAKLLLVYLITENREVNRAEIASLLWPREDTCSSRQNLRQAIAVLKRSFGGYFSGCFKISRNTIEFIGHHCCDIDSERLRKTVKTAACSGDAISKQIYSDTLEQVYKGSFCKGLVPRKNKGMEAWLAMRRHEYEVFALVYAREAATCYMQTKRYSSILDLYRQMVSIEWNNRTHVTSVFENFINVPAA